MRKIVKASTNISPDEFFRSLSFTEIEEKVSEMLGFDVELQIKRYTDNSIGLTSINLADKLPLTRCAFKSVTIESIYGYAQIDEDERYSVFLNIYLWFENDSNEEMASKLFRASIREGDAHWMIRH